MKKFLKITGVIVALLLIVGAVFYYKNNEALPVGIESKEDDELETKKIGKG